MLRVGCTLLLAAAVAAAGCGRAQERAPAAEEPGPVHVHGLGVNPANGALYVATHTGLWRIDDEAAPPERVGDARHDLMGFTVVGDDHFLASGHPDLRSDLPPLLGLLESDDGGVSWQPVALLGEADFHVLRAAPGSVLYGVDASSGRLLRSDEAGRGWRELAVPEGLVDLVADPADADRLIAAGERQLHASEDGGVTWRGLARGSGLLAWPAGDRLYLLAPEGTVWASGDGGRSWQRSGAVDGHATAFAAPGREELLVALHDATIMRSADGGASWARYGERGD